MRTFCFNSWPFSEIFLPSWLGAGCFLKWGSYELQSKLVKEFLIPYTFFFALHHMFIFCVSRIRKTVGDFQVYNALLFTIVIMSNDTFHFLLLFISSLKLYMILGFIVTFICAEKDSRNSNNFNFWWLALEKKDFGFNDLLCERGILLCSDFLGEK